WAGEHPPSVMSRKLRGPERGFGAQNPNAYTGVLVDALELIIDHTTDDIAPDLLGRRHSATTSRRSDAAVTEIVMKVIHTRNPVPRQGIVNAGASSPTVESLGV